MFVPRRSSGYNYEIMSWSQEAAGSHNFPCYDKTADRGKRNRQNGNPHSYFVALQVKIKREDMSVQKTVKIVTTHVLYEMKLKGEKISMLTAYDYSMARILDEAGIDVILVGDSASNVMAGFDTTLPITLDNMIYHAASVVRGVKRALVVVDLPFGTYQGNSREALA